MNTSRAIVHLTTLVLLVTTAACEQNAGMAGGAMEGGEAEEMEGMGMEGAVPEELARTELAPLVKGFYEGGEAFFIHTEASGPQVAGMLTEMMGPEVVVVPELAEVPDTLLADLYVFQSGIEGMGPFGFQPDVFGSVPGDEAYSPLRQVLLVNWAEEATPRELRSEAEILEAAEQGEVTVEETEIVVNAPVLAWPGGQR